MDGYQESLREALDFLRRAIDLFILLDDEMNTMAAKTHLSNFEAAHSMVLKLVMMTGVSWKSGKSNTIIALKCLEAIIPSRLEKAKDKYAHALYSTMRVVAAESLLEKLADTS